jgi:hypothetical protein
MCVTITVYRSDGTRKMCNMLHANFPFRISHCTLLSEILPKNHFINLRTFDFIGSFDNYINKIFVGTFHLLSEFHKITRRNNHLTLFSNSSVDFETLIKEPIIFVLV